MDKSNENKLITEKIKTRAQDILETNWGMKKPAAFEPNSTKALKVISGELIPISIGEKQIQMNQEKIADFCIVANELGLLQDFEKKYTDP